MTLPVPPDDAPGYAFNDVCDFSIPYFRFNMVARAELSDGTRWHEERRPRAALAA